MYCQDQIMAGTTNFLAGSPGWHNFEMITSGNKAEFKAMMENIECGAFAHKDRQIQNILHHCELYNESGRQREVRERCKRKLQITESRRMCLPMYNVELTRAQYDKLFKGKPFRRNMMKKKASSRMSFGMLSRTGFGPPKFARKQTRFGDETNDGVTNI